MLSCNFSDRSLGCSEKVNSRCRISYVIRQRQCSYYAAQTCLCLVSSAGWFFAWMDRPNWILINYHHLSMSNCFSATNSLTMHACTNLTMILNYHAFENVTFYNVVPMSVIHQHLPKKCLRRSPTWTSQFA